MSETGPIYDVYEGILSGVTGLTLVSGGAFVGLKSIFHAAAVSVGQTEASLFFAAVCLVGGVFNCLGSYYDFKLAQNTRQALQMIPGPK